MGTCQPCTYVQTPFAGSTTLVPTGTSTDDGTGAAARFTDINGIRFAPGSDTLVVLEASRLRKVKPAGVVSTYKAGISATGFDTLGVAGDGTIWWGNGNAATSITTAGVVNTYPTANPVYSLNATADGTVYYSTLSSSAKTAYVYRLGSDHAEAPLFNVTDPGALYTDLVIDAMGTLYLTAPNSQNLQRFDGSSRTVVPWSTGNAVLHVAIDSQGDLLYGPFLRTVAGKKLAANPGGNQPTAIDDQGAIYTVVRVNTGSGFASAIVKYAKDVSCK